MEKFFSDDWGLDIENEGVEKHSGENGAKLRMAHNRESGGQKRIVEKTSESNIKSEPPKTGDKLVKKVVKIEKKEKVCTLKDFLEHIEKKKSSRPESRSLL